MRGRCHSPRGSETRVAKSVEFWQAMLRGGNVMALMKRRRNSRIRLRNMMANGLEDFNHGNNHGL